MKIVVDENISGHTLRFLKSTGHTIIPVPRGLDDKKILHLASPEKAVILTRDRDFLNFIPSTSVSIIYIQIHPSIAEHITEAVKNLFQFLNEDLVAGRVIILGREGYEIFKA